MISITTATGNIGSHVLRNLLSIGERVRVIVRNPERLPPEIRNQVEVVRGSSGEVATLLQALEGADALFWCVPPPFRADDPLRHYLQFTEAACEAIKARDVQRVVAISSLGRGVARNAGPISHAHAMDALIEETSVDYRALWNPGFMENLLRQIDAIKHKGTFFLPSRPDLKAPVVAARDIATVATRLLSDRSWSGQGGVAVLGPEDLSYDDMAAILTDVLGRPIRFQQIAAADYKASLMRTGASEPFAQGLIDMRAAINDGLYGIERRTPEATTPTTFRQWCHEVLKPAILD
jgi:uncharacterized protein YbjT (DUF2867 family)